MTCWNGAVNSARKAMRTGSGIMEVTSPISAVCIPVCSPTLSELQVQSEEDLQKIPDLLRSIPDYIDSLLEYTRKQQEEEVLTIDFDSVIDVCDSTVDQGEDSTVLLNLLAQAEGLGLSDEAVARYQSEIREAYLECFIPSYEKIADTMRELENGFNNTEGMAALPEGKDYYEILFAAATALDESPDEIRQMAEERLDKTTSRMGGLAFLYPEPTTAGWKAITRLPLPAMRRCSPSWTVPPMPVSRMWENSPM